jgi:NhaA family Na+:H+ antiporter
MGFTRHARNLLDEFDNYPVATDHMMHERQKALLQHIKNSIDAIRSPAARLENGLHLPVSLFIIPIFALANAGISIDFSSISDTIMEPVSLGIITGLILGKVLGIAGVSYIAIKMKIAKLPEGSTMKQVFGVAFLGGIGFTMSIFVADLAFYGNEELIFQAKIGILLASLISGLTGYFWLKSMGNKV